MKLNKILFGAAIFVLLATFVFADPTITVPGAQAVNENEQLQFVVTATAGDNGTNVFSTDTAFSANLVQNDQTQATFTWTPGYDDAGVKVINFSVSDENSTDSGSVVVTVNDVNRAPSITSSAVTDAKIDDSYYYNVEATDADLDTLTYSLVTKPEGMTIDSDDGEIRWSPNATNIDGNQVEVEVTDGIDTVTQSFDVDVVALEIDRLEVIVDDNDDRLDDGDTFDVELGQDLSFEITIANLYSGDTYDEEIDMEDVEVEITIEDWNGGDEDWRSDEYDIDYDDEEDITLNIDSIPSDIDDGEHEVLVEVTGKDENNNRHTIEWTLHMDVDKKREDIQLTNLALEPSSVSCNRNFMVTGRLKNYGTRDSDEIVLEMRNSQLGISLQKYNIDLDDGDSTSIDESFFVLGDVAPGTYSIRVASYFDLDDYDDQDVSDYESQQLTVLKCQQEEEQEEEEQEEEEQEEEEVEVITPAPAPDEEIPVTPVEDEEGANLLTKNNLYLVGLILANILILLVIIFMLVKLVTR
ncbi:MAG: hypothetical protein MAG795_00901 [Candidatus Woesearchaeota archaeon]|nr:hypothetical protein [Candidatus Woesearchaeota archaeon]